MKKILLLIMLATASGLQAQTLSGPESVDCDTLTNTWYVGNTVSHQILRRNPNGTWGAFVGGLTSGPHGIEVVGSRIYACAGSQIKGYNLSDGTEVFSINTTATFLNGITHDDNGFLYATDFSSKKIYKINIVAASASVFVPTLTPKPNGIIFEKEENRLVFATWGTNAKIMAVSLADSSVSTLKTTTFSNIDGIAQDKAGRFYVAHWGSNAVHRFDHDFVAAPVAVVTGLSSPADIYYNQQTDTLGIPNSGNNTVKLVGFAPISSVESLENVEKLSLFPNPATDFLSFRLDQTRLTQVQVTDALGRSMPCAARQNGDQWVLDVKLLNSGWYQVMALGDGMVAVGRFLKG
jgi:hypothetical protein